MHEDRHAGVLIRGRCPKCNSARIYYWEHGGVWWLDPEDGGAEVERVLIGVPAVACARPRCMWARPHKDYREAALAQGTSPGPVVRQYRG